MKSTKENPFAFLEWYFKKQIIIDLKKFYSFDDNFLVEDGLIECINVDKVNHIIEYENIVGVEGLDKTFKDTFKNHVDKKVLVETAKVVLLIENEFQKKFADKNEVKAYADFLRIKIRHVESFSTLKEFPFLIDYLIEIKDTVNRYSTETKLYGFLPSFKLLAENEGDQQQKIENLFNLLTETPSLIQSSKSEFLKAFSGEEVSEGIHWLVTGKNKGVSKTSLFYFINELINKNHLSRSIINDLNKYVLYTFRDNIGQQLQNLKQSKATVSNNPAQKDRIDTIISSL